MKNKIIVPTNLSSVANQAIKQACLIAAKSNSSLTLLHVLNDKSPSEEEVKRILEAEVETIFTQYSLKCDFIIRAGNIFDVIPDVIRELDYDLMLIGTHGVKGIKQVLFGADILKLVEKISIPVMVIQEDTQLIKSCDKIVLPISSHESFKNTLDAVLYFTNIFGSEVHLYSINKPGFNWPEQLLNNIETATCVFEKNKVRMLRIKEQQNVYSMGYARQTLKYAHAIEADVICMMSVPSPEYYYFANADKEALILNEHHLPILCLGDGKAFNN